MKQHIKTAYHHIRRSPYQALAAIFIMLLTFIVITAFGFITVGSQIVINYFESKPQVTAFFQNTATTSQIKALEQQLKATGNVSKLKFVSQQQAFNIYKAQNKNDPLLLELVTPDILPASLEISANNISDLPSLASFVKRSSIVEQVVYQQDIVSTLVSWTDALRKIGIVLIITLILVSLFIMATIIGIKVSQKKEDIEIMKLIGATNLYIAWPFVMEGIFYSLIGAVLGWAITTGVLFYATPYMMSFLKGIPVLPVNLYFLFALLGVEIILALLLGLYSSLIAVYRYLK